MTKLEKIERDIKALDSRDRVRLIEWLAEMQSDLWDEQIEHDASSGKLDELAERARL